MTYEECEALVEAFKIYVSLSNSADLTDEDLNEAKIIRDLLGDFIATILFDYLKNKG